MKRIIALAREKNISSLFTNLLVAAIGLFSFMLLTRMFSKEQFGDWVLYITLATFVDLLRFGLTKTSLVRFLSGAEPDQQPGLLGSGFRINLWLMLGVAILCVAGRFLVRSLGIELSYGYLLFLTWYPLLGAANLGWNNATALLQAEQNFERMMLVRLSNIGAFFVFLVANFWLGLSFIEVVYVHLVLNALSSLWCAVKGWDGLRYIGKAHRETEKKLLSFGKFSMGTLVGSSLLKSADTFIIGLSPVLGSAGVAMYAIPLKLADLMGIPLRSFTMTAYPRMSRKCIEGDLEGARKIFYQYSGVITFLFLPVAALSFWFAEDLVLLLGGDEYRDSLPLLSTVFRIFTVYSLLLPIDRFTGVLLDSANRPRLNLYKVIFMATANIVVDLVAVFYFQSLIAVAIGTVLFTLLGLFLGFYYLRKVVPIRSANIWTESLVFFRNFQTHLPK